MQRPGIVHHFGEKNEGMQWLWPFRTCQYMRIVILKRSSSTRTRSASLRAGRSLPMEGFKAKKRQAEVDEIRAVHPEMNGWGVGTRVAASRTWYPGRARPPTQKKSEPLSVETLERGRKEEHTFAYDRHSHYVDDW